MAGNQLHEQVLEAARFCQYCHGQQSDRVQTAKANTWIGSHPVWVRWTLVERPFRVWPASVSLWVKKGTLVGHSHEGLH